MVLAVCASSSTFALEDNLPSINAVPEQPKSGQAFSLLVKGTWPDGCGATLKSVQRTGFDITVTMERREAICTQALVPYTLPVNLFANGETAMAGVYRVRYQITHSFEPNPRLLAFQLVGVTSSDQRPSEVEAGYWVADPNGSFVTSGSGVGFLIERQGNAVVASANIYDQRGVATWYFGSGPIIGNAMGGQFYDVRGGQALFSPYRPPSSTEAAGKLQIEFTSPARAVAYFTQPADGGLLSELKLMPISITRFNFAYASVYDSYVGKFVLYGESNGQPVQVFNFERQRFGASSVTGFRDAASGHILVCNIESSGSDPLPLSCVLEKDGVQVASFDQLGYARLFGKTTAGAPLTLERAGP
jgi:hypothetical protein